MSKEKKSFNYTLYALVAFILVAAILAATTVITFKNKYIAFSPESLAVNYVDTIAQTGDGYNAYKFTLSSKGDKYGDFIRKNYMYPLIYPGYEIGMEDDAFKAIKENGFDTDSHKSDATVNDDGTLAGQLSDTMYPYYVELMKTYGWDDYDAVYTSYFSRLIEERKAIFGDDYLSDEVMFTALESNVLTFGNAITGTEKEVAADEKTVIQEESTGLFQVAYGEDYKLTAAAVSKEDIADLDAYKSSLDAETLKTYGVETNDISAAATVTVEVSLEDGTVIASVPVNEVKIGNTWYVENTTTSAASLYALMTDVTAPVPAAVIPTL